MKPFNQIVLNEYFEPALGKSARTTLVFILPLIWGLLTNHMGPAVWISITAQLLSGINLRGGYPIRLFILGTGTLAAAACAYLGTLAGGSLAWSVCIMMVLAFGSGYVRQSGDFGPGLVVAVLLMYLLTLDHPGSAAEAGEMLLWVCLGGAFTLIFVLLTWPFVPFNPFRRSVALTWKALSDWLQVFSQSVEPDKTAGFANELDEKEGMLRDALTRSMEIMSRRQGLAHGRKNRTSYRLVELRLIASLFGASLASLRNACEAAAGIPSFPAGLFRQLLETLSQATHRIALSIVSNRREDVYIAKLRIERAAQILRDFLKNFGEDDPAMATNAIHKNLVLASQQMLRYLDEAMPLLTQVAGHSDFLHISLHNFFTGLTVPQRIPWIRFEFSRQSFVFRFSLRLALGMGIGVALYKYFDIPHGYWIAMTIMIVLQPEFGATFTKSLNRMKGTLLGAVAGALLLMVPLPLPVNLLIITLCSFFMSYYVLRNYAVAAFFITMMVIMLFHLLSPGSTELAWIRVLNTITGCALALASGYAFWPLWEKYRTPVVIAEALKKNNAYLHQIIVALQSGHRPAASQFIKCRREAEIANHNAFDSLRRMKEEPHHKQYNLDQYYALTGRLLRIGRTLTTLSINLQTLSPRLQTAWLENYGQQVSAAFAQLSSLITSGDYFYGDNPLSDLVAGQPKREESAMQDPKALQDERFIIAQFEKIASELSGMYDLIAGRHDAVAQTL